MQTSRWLKLLLLGGWLALVAGCVDTQLTVDTLSNGKKYVGLYGEPAPNPGSSQTLPEFIRIGYPGNTGTRDIYLNGQPIGPLFSYSATSAQVPVSDIKAFLRQGRNILLVDPLSFGPTITFFFDNAGPMMDVVSVNCLDGNCATVDGGQIDLTIRTMDTTGIEQVTLVTHDYQWDGGTDGGDNSRGIPFRKELIVAGSSYPLSRNEDGSWSATVPESSMYELQAVDSYGYQSSDFYLSANEKITSVFKLKINKSVLDAMAPLIMPMIRQMHLYAPVAMDNYGKPYPVVNDPVASPILDTMSRFWRQDAIFYSDLGAVTTNPSDCGYLNTSTWSGASEGVYFNCTQWDGSYCRSGDWVIPPAVGSKAGQCSRIVMWRMELDDVQDMTFTLRDDQVGMLNLDMKLQKDAKAKALYADLGIRNIRCGKQTYCTSTNWLGQCTATAIHTDNFCRDTGGAAVKVLGITVADLGDLKVTADAGQPQGGIKVDIQDGALDLAFDNVSLNLTGLAIGNPFDGFISLLSGLLDGLFVGIVENTLRQNMEDFVLGADLFLENDSQDPPDPSMRLSSEAYQVYTNADNNPATEVEWFMQYAGFFKAVKQHPDVAPVLGSKYTDRDIFEPVDSPSQIDVAISVNIINQALMSMYRSGATHISVTDLKADGSQKVLFGPNASDAAAAAEGDKRVELEPVTPGSFEMRQATTGAQATLYYRNAQMNIETYRSGEWVRDFEVNVDIRAGVYMTAKNGKFQLTILGTPDLVVNSIKTDSALRLLPDSVLRQLIQFGIDLVMNVAVPQIADTYAELDYPPIAGPEGSNTELQLTTDKIEANNDRHLNFGLSLDVVPVP